ncbi:MAG: hypothetical protein WBQ18_10190 [Solirubrobacteraceae bacterium]
MLALACGWAATAHAARPRSPTLAPNDTLIDGPSSAIVSVNGLAMARDGTGGLVYLKSIGGTVHVFLSRLVSGAYQAPVQVDGGLLGSSSQPVVAAGQDGLLLVAFINGGQLYTVQAATSGTPLSAPAVLYPAARNPSISMSNFGKAYLAFTATDGAGGGDVRAGYYYGGQWGLEPTPLDANPAAAAGTGTGRPQVTTAGDGVGIVAWGEGGHIITRKVTKTSPSPVAEQADVPNLNGAAEVTSTDPVIGSGGDSSYAAVAFQETFSSGGGAQQTRVLINRLHGSQYDGIEQPDGLGTPGPEGSDQAQTAVTEYGAGFVTAEHNQTHQLFATTLGSNERFGQTLRVDSLPNGGTPDAVPATAGLVSNFIVWQQTPGVAGPAEIRLRYAPDGADLGPEEIISSSAQGATNADLGLVAAGDVSGDASATWVQGSGAATEIFAAQLFQPPGGFVPAQSFSYARTARPTLAWSGAAELWGSPQYTVRIDGAPLPPTTGLSTTPPVTIANGRHVYQVTAVNLAGLSSTSASATVFVDTLAPRVRLRLKGSQVPKSTLHLHVTYFDPAPSGQTRAATSGVAKVTVKWGDGSPTTRIRRTDAAHAYTRRRTFTIVVTAVDRAGNVTVVKHKVRIKKPTPPRKHRRKAGKTVRRR